MNLQLRNNITTLNINPKWKLDLFGLKPRVTQQKRYGRPGAKLMGDRQEDARTATLKKTVTGRTDALYITEVNNVYAMFDPAQAPCYIEDIENNRRILIESAGLETKVHAEGTEMRVEIATLSLICPEVFWEAMSPTIVTSDSGGLANNEILTINNPSQKPVCYPIITITSDVANSNINLLNTTTGGILTVSTNAFVPGTTLEIDCQNGLIWLSDGITRANILSALGDNTGMLFFIPGDNDIKYESAFGAINISIAFRRKWAF